jgi:hypothetical protein
MTTITSHPAPTGSPRRPFPFLRLALAALLLGVAVFAVGARFVWLSIYNLPYQQSLNSAPENHGSYQDHAEIRTDDGRLYQFTGNPWAVQEWVRATTGRLRTEYGLDDREQLGNGLITAGCVLGGAGVVLAGCGAVVRVTRRSRPGSPG